jgi:hypothetical protein
MAVAVVKLNLSRDRAVVAATVASEMGVTAFGFRHHTDGEFLGGARTVMEVRGLTGAQDYHQLIDGINRVFETNQLRRR